jgi:hypothetical protein
MSLSGLLDNLDSQYLDDLLDVDYTDFDKEDGFIEHTKQSLDGASVRHGGDSLHITTQSIHQSPKVEFTLPSGTKATKELGDFLFILDTNSLSTDSHRAMLTQAKFSKSPPSWAIDLYQFHLISNLPEFEVVSPRTHRSFKFNGVSETSFSNFVFASWFDDPFYTTGERMRPGVTNFDYSTDNATFNRSNLTEPIWPIEYTRSILKRFIRGTFGVAFDDDPEIPNLVNHLRCIARGDHSLQPDGGAPTSNDEPSGFVIIDITTEIGEQVIEE